MQFIARLGEISPEGLFSALQRVVAILNILLFVLKALEQAVTKGDE